MLVGYNDMTASKPIISTIGSSVVNLKLYYVTLFGARCNLGVPRSTVLAPTEHIACFISYLFFFPIDTGKPAHVWLLLLTDWFCYYVVVSVMKLEELKF
ncbi:hypothetical protein QQP08_020005 [Theobroma cacao]|nr:hypothetical protein QQP08_020005 [Theobroma cacao]